MNTIETETYKGYQIDIGYDESPCDPRTEWDNFTVIHCCSSRYYLGEKNHKSWEDCDAALREARKQGDLVFKVFAYIHGGTALSLESFHGSLPQGHAQFDSGQCGYIVVKKKDIIENWGKKNWTEKLRKKAYEVAEGDIKVFTAYLNGQVFGYNIDEIDDSCYGYYETEDALAEAKLCIDYAIEQDIKKHYEQMKIWIKNGVPLNKRHSLEVALEV